MASIEGGDRIIAQIDSLGNDLAPGGKDPTVKVGFISPGTYPDGTPVAMIAAIQEFGARIERAPSETTIYRKTNKAGTAFVRGGRFVKKEESNFASTHAVGAHVITIPSRPYFRNMVAENKDDWPAQIAARLKATDFDGVRALGQMGEILAGQLRKSILALQDPPLAPSTIARKGFAKPLIDTGVMSNRITYEVEE